MKRTALRRRTPLSRAPMKPWHRDPDDPTRVDPAEAQYVLARDGSCIAAQLDPGHRCDGAPRTLDHVPERGRNAVGLRATCSEHEVADRHVLVVLCNFANTGGWASAHRDDERAYLARVEVRDDPPHDLNPEQSSPSDGPVS